MRKVGFVVALLVAGVVAGASARAEKETKEKPKDAGAAAKAVLDKLDAAFNAGDAKALVAFYDKTYFGAGPTVSAHFEYDTMVDHLTKMVAKGGHFTRDAVTVRADEDGDTAWFVADYTFVPKVPPGALPVRRKCRESGVMMRKGKEWKVVMSHMSFVQPDDN